MENENQSSLPALSDKALAARHEATHRLEEAKAAAKEIAKLCAQAGKIGAKIAKCRHGSQ